MIVCTLVAKVNSNEVVELISKNSRKEILIEKDKLVKSNQYSAKQLKIKTFKFDLEVRYSYKIVCKFDNELLPSEIIVSPDLKKCLETNIINKDYFIVKKSKKDISFYLNAINEVVCLTKVMNYITNIKEYGLKKQRNS